MREIATLAFVLHARAYGESDRIVTLLTEQQGKITGIAKGAKNSRRRFGGTLEPFLHVRVVFRHRPASDLVFLFRSELVTALRRFTRDLDYYAAGSYVLDLTDRMVFGRESGREVYGLVREALELLESGARIDPLLRAFEMHLLGASGYAPQLHRCRGCGETPGRGGGVFLALERGGLVCRQCVRPGEPLRPVHPATAEALAVLAAAPLADALTRTPPPAVLAEAGAVAEHLLGAVIHGPVRSRAFLSQTRVDSPGHVR